MSDMTRKITTREFVRDFARIKQSVSNGCEVVVSDRDGRHFIFKACEQGPSLAAQTKDLRGKLSTGVAVKSLKGFGRNRA